MNRAVRLVLLFVAVLCLSACRDDRYGVPSLKLRYSTAIERRASLSALRRAWSDRPERRSADGNLYERGILNRAAFFGRKVKGTETYQPACEFWMNCVREHISRYEDEAHRFQN